MARSKLWIFCHALDGQHAAIGRVPRLSLVEQGLDVFVRHPAAHNIHGAVGAQAQVLRLHILWVDEIFMDIFLDPPHQLRVKIGHRRCHDRAILARQHIVGIGPVQGAASR